MVEDAMTQFWHFLEAPWAAGLFGFLAVVCTVILFFQALRYRWLDTHTYLKIRYGIGQTEEQAMGELVGEQEYRAYRKAMTDGLPPEALFIRAINLSRGSILIKNVYIKLGGLGRWGGRREVLPSPNGPDGTATLNLPVQFASGFDWGFSQALQQWAYALRQEGYRRKVTFTVVLQDSTGKKHKRKIKLKHLERWARPES